MEISCFRPTKHFPSQWKKKIARSAGEKRIPPALLAMTEGNFLSIRAYDLCGSKTLLTAPNPPR
jgi:hypothetical protein